MKIIIKIDSSYKFNVFNKIFYCKEIIKNIYVYIYSFTF